MFGISKKGPHSAGAQDPSRQVLAGGRPG
jgi:hypothetical protein